MRSGRLLKAIVPIVAGTRLAPHIALPAYSYVPGVQPHPLRDPDGHGGVPPDLHVDTVWRWGVDCFQHRYYWEAHEAWEVIWRGLTRGEPAAEGVQGLIGAAAFVLKRHMGHPAPRLYGAMTRRLSMTGVVGGVDASLTLERVHAFARGGDWPTLGLRPPVLAPRSTTRSGGS
ncbi:MAG: hypothetical protein ACI9MC_002221 [Kiritimatiellia bacterium]